MRIMIICFLISFANLLSNDYYSIYNENGSIGNFFFIKNDNLNYKNNSIFIKLNRNISSEKLQLLVNDIIRKNSIIDFQINKIERPFEKFNNQLLNSNKLSKIININFNSKSSSWLISKILQESGEFAYVVPERIYRFSSINSNDPFNTKTDYLDSLNVNDVWQVVKGDSSVTIGIVDSGVMIEHEDLKQSIKINYAEIPNDGKDNDNNGFVDDYLGWDFVGDISAVDLYNDIVKPDNHVTPTKVSNNHGTHVTGIACAKTNNELGVSSIAYNLSFIPVKVSPDDVANLNYLVKPFEGILYALNMGADVINCSWLNDDFDPLAQDIVDEVASRGSVIVCAAGNFSLDNYYYPFITPASLQNVISVGAVYKDNKVTDFSHYGWNVDIFAPGSSIYSTIMNNNYGNMSGTSMASPLVAAVVGIIKKLHPDWTYKQIELQLRATAKKFSNITESDTTKYWGALDVLSAVKSNLNIGISNPGLTIESYYLDSIKIIEQQYTNYKLNLNVANLLSEAKSINIDLIPLVNYVELSRRNFSIDKLYEKQIETITLNIKLMENTPYYEGNIPFLVIYRSEKYRNLEIINIPYKIETSTKFIAAQYFDDYLDNIWLDAKSPSKYSLWAIGNSFTSERGIVFSFGKNHDPIKVSKNPTAIFPFNENKAIVGFKSDNQNENSELAITENAGLSFKTIDKPFSEIYDIHFYNDINGIVVGSNNASYLGIKTSKDGGNSWQFSPLVAAEQKENIYKISFKNSKSLILTSKSNLYFSDSIGFNWTKIGKINSVNDITSLILSDNKIIAGFSSDNDITTINFSLDFGKNWLQNKLNISGKLIKAFFLENTDIIYSLFDNGVIIYSDNYFKTFEYIPNKDSRFGQIELATEYIDSCGIRCWQLNYNLYFSDIENVNPQSIGELEIAGRNQILFDSLEINKKSLSEILFITNSGKKVLSINSYKFSDNSTGSFILEKKYPKIILPCQLFDAKIIFSPKKVGWHYDTLIIQSANKNLQFNLSGFCYDPSSVVQIEKSNLNIFPNPASDFITIYNFNNEFDYNLNVEIFDVMGLIQISEKLNPISTKKELNIKDLTPGVYFIKFGKNVGKFVKF